MGQHEIREIVDFLIQEEFGPFSGSLLQIFTRCSQESLGSGQETREIHPHYGRYGGGDQPCEKGAKSHFPEPYVLQSKRLKLGKGSIVCNSQEQLRSHYCQMKRRRFKRSGLSACAHFQPLLIYIYQINSIPDPDDLTKEVACLFPSMSTIDLIAVCKISDIQ